MSSVTGTLRGTSRDYLVTVWCDKDPEPKFDPKTMKYLIYQKEAAPTTGNLHWQTYVIFKQPKRVAGCQKALGVGKENKVIRPRGSSESCADYCRKQETAWADHKSFGTFEVIQPEDRYRSGYSEAIEAIQNGKSETDIAREFPNEYVRYHQGFAKLIQHQPVPYNGSEFEPRWDLLTEIKSEVIIGLPGIGKTEYAKQHFENALFVTHMDDLRSFNDSYDGIIFDDMDFRHMPRCAQIHIVDFDNPRSIHCRYSVARIPAGTKKIFTCNEYPFIDDNAIERRVTVTHVN